MDVDLLGIEIDKLVRDMLDGERGLYGLVVDQKKFEEKKKKLITLLDAVSRGLSDIS